MSLNFWRSLVGKLWATIIVLVASVLIIMALFLLPYIDVTFANSTAIKKLFTIVAIIGFSLTTFFALFLFTKITQPMQQLIRAADAIRNGKYDTRLSLRTSDEIGELAKSFNHMAAELEDTIRSLNHEKEHLSSVLRSMSDAVITFNVEGRVILTNPQGQKVLYIWRDMPWKEEDDEPADFYHEVPEPLYAMFERVLVERVDKSGNVHVKQSVWSVHMAPLYSDNVVRGVVAVLRDVTDEVNQEKIRRDFLVNISHEIRTPLSMMQGYSEALLDGMATSQEESQELIQVIHDESLRMGRLVKDLLDLSRMEAGHTDMAMKPLDLGEVIERVYRKFLVRAKDRDIMLTYEPLSEDLHLQAADGDRLEQVFTNLLDNAFRHTPAGKSIKITAGRQHTELGEALQVQVKDDGVGIAIEDLPFIFERFYKADKARVRGESGGTGLGLAIVKNIIEAHHGTISADSVVGQGTVFTIILPVEIK
ncbi:ATP-binding protein [Paenibacillus sediminis]|uniref:histidine kinase n=1 Tax=Paenibacillus sediminis TaxID=664909 RepID=A0ABS4H043_9BACL|nr:two-component system sensor histidine kinase ResE [Paenibacillus sediminis]